MTLKFVSIPAKRLAQSILSTDMAFTLNNIEGWDGDNLAAADFGTDLYVAFMNSTKTVVEFMKIDPATIASTSITISKRGLQYDGDLSTEVTANKHDWTAGDTFVMLGTDTPQMFQWLKEYIDGIAIAGAPDASLTAKGLVEIATQTEVDAGDDSGSTTAPAVVTPSTIRAKKYHDYIADAGSTDAYAITVVPAITAYANGQEFTFKANTANTGACTLNVCGIGAITIKKDVSSDLVTGDILANQIVKVSYDGTNMQVLSKTSPSIVQFGGSGADGALSVTSGTTTIDLGGVNVFTKNYTTISISSGATLAFSNPASDGTIIILKATGNVTITGTVNASGMGGNSGVIGYGMLGTELVDGQNGGSGTGGAGGVIFSTNKKLYTKSSNQLYSRALYVYAGSGGGDGQGGDAPNSASGGSGGRGGAGLYIECRGALDFSGTINTSGLIGANGANGTTTSGGGGGGGGGSAGSIVVLYNTLTANTGTLTSVGGAGGTSGSGSGGDLSSLGAGGGGGGSYTSAGGAGGNTDSTGNAAAGAGAGGGGGGGNPNGVGKAGGAASSTESGLVAQNIYLF